MVVVLFTVRTISQYMIHLCGNARCHLWNYLRHTKHKDAVQ